MEVGAVKQAFNNEVIHLKPRMSQAKIQIIHKLTRKAKVLAGKKGPEQIQTKMKRKAECAVREVLQIKTVKTKDLAKFAVTHKGKLIDYLNKPQIDLDRACARLLLHKSLQDKYKLFRDTYTDIAIDDLLMSREERRKIKQDEREKAKEKQRKKMEKNNVWKVEKQVPINKSNEPEELNEEESIEIDIEQDNSQINFVKSKINKSKGNNREEFDEESDNSVPDLSDDNDKEQESEGTDEESTNNTFKKLDKPKLLKLNKNIKPTVGVSDDFENDQMVAESDPESEDDNDEEDEEDDSGDNAVESIDNFNEKSNTVGASDSENSYLDEPDIKKPKLIMKPNLNIKNDTNKMEKVHQNKTKTTSKNKKLRDKFQMKNLPQEDIHETTKIVDPFFITASGESYMSLVEPRPPDEVKEHHREGNRKLRRAAMFGRIPKPRRQDNFNNDNNYQNKYNSGRDFSNKREFNNKNTNNFNKSNFSGNKTASSNNTEKVNDTIKDKAPEKLHPSWEAKKKLSGIKPFEGKKIVFD